MANEDISDNLGVSRRDLIKRGAVVGGAVVWATPIVQSVKPAFAQVPNGTPPPNGEGCDCNSSAFALSASGTILGQAVNIGPLGAPEPNCEVGVSGVINAEVLCAQTSSTTDACSASASVSSLSIPAVAVAASVITSSVTAPCDCSPASGTAGIASLTVGGAAIPIATGPNSVLVNALGIMIVANRQVCEGGQHVVQALFVDVAVPGVATVQVVVAESRAQAGDCACTFGGP